VSKHLKGPEQRDGLSQFQQLRNSSAMPKNPSGIKRVSPVRAWPYQAVAAQVFAIAMLMLALVGTSVTMGLATEDNTSELNNLMEVHGLSGESFPSFWSDPFCSKDFTAGVLGEAMPRLGVAFLVWLVGMYGNNVSQAWLQKHMAGHYEAKLIDAGSVGLWDLGHELLPAVGNTAICDLIAGGAPLLVAIRFWVLPGPLSMRWTILTRSLLICGLLWGFRGIMIVSTVLPNPDPSCKPQITFPDNIFWEAFANMPIVFWHSELTCQDVMFSGHTVVITLPTLFLLRYSAWSPWVPPSTSSPSSVWSGVLLFKITVIMIMLVGYYVIIASKLHYTADVLVGSFLTVMLFQTYHSVVRVAHFPQMQAPLARRCGIYHFLRWFDKNAVDVAAAANVATPKTALRNC